MKKYQIKPLPPLPERQVKSPPMKELQPIRERSHDYADIESHILEVLRREIYVPILEQLRTPFKLRNTLDDLLQAIHSGAISFSRGGFSGSFNSAISRELKKMGAKWDRSSHTWRIPQSRLSIEVRNAISASNVRFEATLSKIDKAIAAVVPEAVADKLRLETLFDRQIFRLDQAIAKTVKGLTIMPELTREQRVKIARDYTNNMKLSIQDWTQKAVKDLRGKIEEKVLAGHRYSGLVETIRKNYGVSKNKARFLARQETSLLMTKFKEVRYSAAGVDEYKWNCVAGSAAHPVRPAHKALAERSQKGETFRWDRPPLLATDGKYKNPGEDFNCRCWAVPVVKFKK